MAAQRGPGFGMLHLTVFEARTLRNVNKAGKAMPVCFVTVGSQSLKTRAAAKGTPDAPDWNEAYWQIPISQATLDSGVLTLTVKVEGMLSSKSVGSVEFKLKPLLTGQTHESWFTLTRDGSNTGDIRVRLYIDWPGFVPTVVRTPVSSGRSTPVDSPATAAYPSMSRPRPMYIPAASSAPAPAPVSAPAAPAPPPMAPASYLPPVVYATAVPAVVPPPPGANAWPAPQAGPYAAVYPPSAYSAYPAYAYPSAPMAPMAATAVPPPAPPAPVPAAVAGVAFAPPAPPVPPPPPSFGPAMFANTGYSGRPPLPAASTTARAGAGSALPPPVHLQHADSESPTAPPMLTRQRSSASELTTVATAGDAGRAMFLAGLNGTPAQQEQAISRAGHRLSMSGDLQYALQLAREDYESGCALDLDGDHVMSVEELRWYQEDREARNRADEEYARKLQAEMS